MPARHPVPARPGDDDACPAMQNLPPSIARFKDAALNADTLANAFRISCGIDKGVPVTVTEKHHCDLPECPIRTTLFEIRMEHGPTTRTVGKPMRLVRHADLKGLEPL